MGYWLELVILFCTFAMIGAPRSKSYGAPRISYLFELYFNILINEIDLL